MQASKQIEQEYWRLVRGVREFKKSSQVFLSYSLCSVISVHYLTMDYLHLSVFNLTAPPPIQVGYTFQDINTFNPVGI